MGVVLPGLRSWENAILLQLPLPRVGSYVKFPIFQIYAFTSRLFRGNPAAVVILDEWLPEDVMAAVAAENNLAESAFVILQPGRAVRWFTPAVEVDLCGHATLAAAHVILNSYRPDEERCASRRAAASSQLVERRLLHMIFRHVRDGRYKSAMRSWRRWAFVRAKFCSHATSWRYSIPKSRLRRCGLTFRASPRSRPSP